MNGSVFIHEPATALRGSRDYVHSTDLYDETVAAVHAAGLSFEGPIDFKIKAKIVHRPRYIISSPGHVVDAAAATCTFTSKGIPYIASIAPGSEQVTEIKSYDEGLIVRASQITGLKAVLKHPTHLRPIEAVTALAVHLHKSALPPPAGRRWMLGQLSIRRPLSDDESHSLVLEITKVLAATMTRTGIEAKDGRLGTMVFILAGSKI